MKVLIWIKIIRLIALIIFLTAGAGLQYADAANMGPFNVPPIGLGELFRETPQFIIPDDHKGTVFQISTSLRWLNIWAYHMVSEPSYGWENPPQDFPLMELTFHFRLP
jgi:hypothetical protein